MKQGNLLLYRGAIIASLLLRSVHYVVLNDLGRILVGHPRDEFAAKEENQYRTVGKLFLWGFFFLSMLRDIISKAL